MKKIVALIMAAVSLLAMSLLGGCGTDPYEYEKVEGFFVYRKQRFDPAVSLVGLTELGNQQEVIVMPKTVGGYKYSFTDYTGKGIGTNRFTYMRWEENDKLKKIYFEYELFGGNWWAGDSDGKIIIYTFEKCSALKKVIINGRAALCTDVSDIEVYGNEFHVFMKTNEYGEYQNYRFRTQLADVHFKYNYEGAPNDGCYWIDDVEDGEKIEIIPPEPKREGYTFAGWYCEPECENEWSFENTIRKIEVSMDDFYPEDYVTFIYAKWFEN